MSLRDRIRRRLSLGIVKRWSLYYRDSNHSKVYLGSRWLALNAARPRYVWVAFESTPVVRPLPDARSLRFLAGAYEAGKHSTVAELLEDGSLNSY